MDVANELLDAIEIIVDKKVRENTTQIYPGICKSVSGSSCVMSINGKDNTIQFYGSIPTVGAIYRVFVPSGNMSMAFAITGNDDRKDLYYSNHNLLDNWYFANPVNQQGQTSYTGRGYTIDRWIADQLTIVPGGVCVPPNSYFRTLFNFDTANKTFTMSVLTADNVLSEYTFKTGSDAFYHNSIVNGIRLELFSNPGGNSYFMGYPTEEMKVFKAAKVELGSQQTLAHQENGNWVLNEIPDYGEQLRRCLRHDYIIGRADDAAPVGLGTAYSDTSVIAVIELPEMMRANPTVSITGTINLRFSESKNVSVSSVNNYGFSGDKVQLYFPGLSGLTQGQSCDIYVSRGSKMEFNSNL